MSKRFFSPVRISCWCCLAIGLGQVLEAADFVVANRDEVLVLTSKIQAAQFLNHATFGPTQTEVDQLALEMRQLGTISAATAWIDRQMDVAQTPAGLHSDRQESMIASDFPTYVLYTRSGVQGAYVYTPTGGIPAFTNSVSPTRFRQHAWWHNTIAGQDQLRQKTAWALAQIFAVNNVFTNFNEEAVETALTGGPTGKPRFFGISNYYDIFVKNAFGNYLDVLKKVTYHGVMGDWLSYRGNRRAQNGLEPDENYAREVMQLFSIGLELLSDDGVPQTNASGVISTYDNDDIRQYAKIFTGLGYAYGTYAPENTSLNPYTPYTGTVSADPNGTVKFQIPMRMAPSQHDRGPKTLLNGVNIADPDGDVSHTETTANNEITVALQGLFNHQSCPPFVVHRLIQRLVKSNPSRAYVGRVVAAFKGTGVPTRGNLANVVKAILLDPEAWQPVRVQYQRSTSKFIVTTMGTEDSRLQEPVLNYTRFIRFFKGDARYEKATAADYTTPIVVANEFRLNTRDVEFDQSPYEMPSVFNFYYHNHQPPQFSGYVASARLPDGELSGPEFQIANDLTSNRTGNYFRTLITSGVRTENLQTYNPTSPFSSTQNSTTGGIYTIVNESTRCRVLFDFSVEQNLADNTSEVDQLIERLDMYLCGGTLSSQVKTRLRTAILAEIATAGGNGGVSASEALAIARGAILAIVTCPSFLVTE